MLKKLGPSLGHVLLGIGVQLLCLLIFRSFIGEKAALCVGAALATGWFFAREIEQIYPHFPRFGLAPLPPERRPNALDWMRAFRQAAWPSAIVIAIAVYSIYADLWNYARW